MAGLERMATRSIAKCLTLSRQTGRHYLDSLMQLIFQDPSSTSTPNKKDRRERRDKKNKDKENKAATNGDTSPKAGHQKSDPDYDCPPQVCATFFGGDVWNGYWRYDSHI